MGLEELSAAPERGCPKNTIGGVQKPFGKSWTLISHTINKQTMEKIIGPVNREKLCAELMNCQLIKHTFRRNNEIYSFTYPQAPSLMYEVARLREEAFRAIGCGTGNILDLDDQDLGQGSYRQLIVWNPKDQEIVSGYRYAVGKNYIRQTNHLSMAHYFRFSKSFVSDYLPYSIELGRAWVNPLYQPSATNSRSIFALDNLWEGIGALIAENESVKYLYGKVTIPGSYNQTARNLIYWFLDHYFSDKSNLLTPISPVDSTFDFDLIRDKVSGSNIEDDFKIIANHVKSLGAVVPPLISAYFRLAQRMVTFGTAPNPELGNSFETGIMITVSDIYPEKYARYIKTNQRNLLVFENQE
jgi:hypothetical protein